MSKFIATKCSICLNEKDIIIKYKLGNRNILLCPNCQTEFLFPKPTFEEIKNMYTSDYYAAWGMNKGENDAVANMKKKTFYNMLSKVKKYKNDGNLLDIGTASGFLLEVAQKLGFNVFGVELSEYASSIAKKKFGNSNIYNGTLETSRFQNNFFDVIVMCDLLEHVHDPIATLRDAKEKLKDDGIIAVVFPDTYSFTSKLMRGKWPHYNTEHLFCYNKPSISKICEILDLKLLSFKKSEKTMTASYMKFQFSVHKLFLITFLFKIIGSIPLIKDIGFSVYQGNAMIILAKN